MRKIVKMIIVFIIGLIISAVISVYAATVISAGEVSYTSNSNTTVQTGLDNLYTKVNTLYDKANDYQNNLKIIKYSSNVTVDANATTKFILGSLDCGTGYKYLGVVPYQNGYGDQWTVSYSYYGGSIIALVKSKHGSSLTSKLYAQVVCGKTSSTNNIYTTTGF